MNQATGSRARAALATKLLSPRCLPHALQATAQHLEAKAHEIMMPEHQPPPLPVQPASLDHQHVRCLPPPPPLLLLLLSFLIAGWHSNVRICLDRLLCERALTLQLAGPQAGNCLHQVPEGLVLQLPQHSMAPSPSSQTTTPNATAAPQQVLLMQGFGSAPPTAIPVGSVLLPAATSMQARSFPLSLSRPGPLLGACAAAVPPCACMEHRLQWLNAEPLHPGARRGSSCTSPSRRAACTGTCSTW